MYATRKSIINTCMYYVVNFALNLKYTTDKLLPISLKRILGSLNTPVSGITSDNAADMVTVIAHLKWPHIFIVLR